MTIDVEVSTFAVIEKETGLFKYASRALKHGELSSTEIVVPCNITFEWDRPDQIVELSESKFNDLWKRFIATHETVVKDDVKKFLGFKI